MKVVCQKYLLMFFNFVTVESDQSSEYTGLNTDLRMLNGVPLMEGLPEPAQTSKMESFATPING